MKAIEIIRSLQLANQNKNITVKVLNEDEENVFIDIDELEIDRNENEIYFKLYNNVKIQSEKKEL